MAAPLDTPGGPLLDRNRIPCLDGLRAISITLVLLAHARLSQGFPLANARLKRWIPFTGATGVCLFFIISGFLITTLLLNEKERNGSVSLGRFYIRRGLRIFPAFYCFLAVAAIVSAVGVIPPLHRMGLFASATYWSNFYNGPPDWILGHTWSLSVEEQFYLFWPVLIACLSRRLAVAAGLLIVAGWPLLRLARHGFLSAGDGFTALDTAALETILYGSILALLVRGGRSLPFCQNLTRGPAGLLVPVVVLWILFRFNLEGASYCPPSLTFLLPVVRNVCLTWFLWWAVNNARHPFGRLMEARPVVFLGVISYSVYLWQQPFLGASRGWACTFPQNLAFAVAAAALSYLLIEQPLNRLRSRWRAAPEVRGSDPPKQRMHANARSLLRPPGGAR